MNAEKNSSGAADSPGNGNDSSDLSGEHVRIPRSRFSPLPADEPKPFLDHLEELRGVLLRSIVVLALGTVVAFPLAPRIFRLLRAPLSSVTDNPDQFLRSIEITGGFSILVQLVLWTGLIFGAPLILFFIGRFVFPGLTEKERRGLTGGMALAAGLFLLGVALGYFMALPVALRVMFRLHAWLSIQPEWTINSYVAFSMRLLLAFGLAFELPVVILVLGWLGLVSSAFLRSKRRHAIVIIFILAAIMTPPDVFSQVVMGLPMILLYELCIWTIRIMEGRENRGEP